MLKVILKTALKTLLAVAVAALVAFAIASLGFPSEMAGLCENAGNYSMAAGYASLSYAYSGNVNDLNRCFVDSVYAGNDGDIVKYGDKLIAEERFGEICASNSKTVPTENGEVFIDYKQFVYGHVACAKYRRGGKAEAVETAKAATEDMTGFPVNNALAVLSLQVIESGDGETARTLFTEVEKFDTETDYYKALKDELKKVGGQV